MKLKKLEELSVLIKQEDFFDFIIRNIDWDTTLEKRDQPEFDDLWVENHESLKNHVYFEDDSQREVDYLRDYVFKEVFKMTNNSEVAGYVSDDFGLLGEALAKSRMTNWLDEMLTSYMSGKFPS
jgi:hypothetical protein